MENYNGYPAYQPNMYYQPTVTTPVYQQRWQQPYQINPYQQTNIPQNNIQQVNTTPNVNMIWVQGESGARGYNLPNNTTMPLWDSENQTIYIKSVDANGKPSMTILDYKERVGDVSKGDKSIEYATKEQIDNITSQFTAINDKLGVLGSYVTKDQFDSLSQHLNDLGNQIDDIENRLTGFGKSQNSQNNQSRRGGK